MAARLVLLILFILFFANTKRRRCIIKASIFLRCGPMSANIFARMKAG
jgi:hypothetical protein